MKLAIYHGKEKPILAIGCNQVRLLSFAYNTMAWHYWNPKCRATNRAISALVRKGCMEVNEFGQFRFKFPD